MTFRKLRENGRGTIGGGLKIVIVKTKEVKWVFIVVNVKYDESLN